jgi:hypothetical protein
MIHSLGKKIQIRNLWIQPAGTVLLLALASGCGQSTWEVNEAKQLASVFKKVMPEASVLLEREHVIADEMKISLDESKPPEVPEPPPGPEGPGGPGGTTPAKAPVPNPDLVEKARPEEVTVGTKAFRDKINGYLTQLVEVRNRRREIQSTIAAIKFHSPMVSAVQKDAVAMMEHEVARDDDWILYVRNVQQRAALGRRSVAPEYSFLLRELEVFVKQVDGTPLQSQMRNLVEEFRFDEGEIRP